jgi:hypothetical protein
MECLGLRHNFGGDSTGKCTERADAAIMAAPVHEPGENHVVEAEARRVLRPFVQVYQWVQEIVPHAHELVYKHCNERRLRIAEDDPAGHPGLVYPSMIADSSIHEGAHRFDLLMQARRR